MISRIELQLLKPTKKCKLHESTAPQEKVVRCHTRSIARLGSYIKLCNLEKTKRGSRTDLIGPYLLSALFVVPKEELKEWPVNDLSSYPNALVPLGRPRRRL